MALNDPAALISDVGTSYALLWGMVSSVFLIPSVVNFVSPISQHLFFSFFTMGPIKMSYFFGSLFFIWFCLWVSLLCFFYQKVNTINWMLIPHYYFSQITYWGPIILFFSTYFLQKKKLINLFYLVLSFYLSYLQ